MRFPLLIPVAAQIVRLIAGAIYSGLRKPGEVVVGIIWGFGLEFAALFVLIIVASSAH